MQTPQGSLEGARPPPQTPPETGEGKHPSLSLLVISCVLTNTILVHPIISNVCSNGNKIYYMRNFPSNRICEIQGWVILPPFRSETQPRTPKHCGGARPAPSLLRVGHKQLLCAALETMTERYSSVCFNGS